ncbi:XRE family transcriptional regulator [Vreelandella rituensis]|uniref:XRE family transcriptional regulator n=1 Tax=Vreelandella rituensis TaxID=2282306 RepID=A0A368U993_9GAMM|nr:XRE family transcriptional regulator [Halomonas rituensis]
MTPAPSPRVSPTPEHIRETRLKAGLTQTQAGALVHTTCRTWQQWEAGDRGMHPAFWELFCLKLPSVMDESVGDA